jgi:Fur family zinc uptake transcriptional regulator
MAQAVELTRNQSLVLDTLSSAHSPLSAYEILDRLRDDGLKAPLQVYRALDKLREKGLAHRLESLNAFVVCAGTHDHKGAMIAFAICDSCGQVSEFADDLVRGRLEGWAKLTGFCPKSTVIEIRGLCAGCAETGAAA